MTAPKKPDAETIVDSAEKKESRIHRRGFGSMTPEQVRALGARGGKRAHKRKTAHRYSKEEASAAGKKSAAAREKIKSDKAAKAKKRAETRAAKKAERERVVAGPHHECAIHGKFFGAKCLECSEEREG